MKKTTLALAGLDHERQFLECFMNTEERNWQVFSQPRYIEQKFDRRSFDPISNADHRKTLYQLRQVGAARARYCLFNIPNYGPTHFDPTHFGCCASYALRNLWYYEIEDVHQRDGGPEYYLDIGAGTSPDVLIARSMGYGAYSLDLFPPDYPVSDSLRSSGNKFYVKADAVALPFGDCSFDYISSQAMIALVPQKERLVLYREIYRVLKIGGTFSLTGAKLKCGYGFKQGDENERARQLEWEVASMENGFIGQRQS